MVEPQGSVVTASPRRSLRRRLGCGAALVIWFALILSPCVCIILAVQGEILVHLSDVPGNSLRIWLVNEAHERGIGIARPTVHPMGNADTVCVQTAVSFVFWEGEGKPTSYCECYKHPAQSGEWELYTSSSGDCPS
jgi:hypothetical protein